MRAITKEEIEKIVGGMNARPKNGLHALLKKGPGKPTPPPTTLPPSTVVGSYPFDSGPYSNPINSIPSVPAGGGGHDGPSPGGGGGGQEATTHETPDKHTYTVNEHLTSSQLTTLSTIIDDGYSDGLKANEITIMADDALYESSLNPTAQNNEPGNTAYGLFQYNDATWNTAGGTMDIHNIANQINAMSLEILKDADIYTSEDSDSLSFADYVNAVHHYGSINGYKEAGSGGAEAVAAFNEKSSTLGLDIKK